MSAHGYCFSSAEMETPGAVIFFSLVHLSPFYTVSVVEDGHIPLNENIENPPVRNKTIPVTVRSLKLLINC